MSLKKTALHDTHLALGAKMVDFAGFAMPLKYGSEREEHMAVRQAAGLFDVSHMGEFLVKGPQAEAFLQHITSNDVSKLSVGQAQYSCLPTPQGGIVDDLLVYKEADQLYMAVVNAANIEKDWAWFQEHNQVGAELEDISADTCLLAVQGPKATAVVDTLSPLRLAEIPFYHFAIGEVADIPDVVISNTGYTGAGGFELYVGAAHAAELWQRLLDVGHELGLRPAGLAARDTLRLEMGYNLYGQDITDSTSALEAGLGWITKLDTHFVGSDFLRQQKEEGLSRRLAGFKVLDKGIPRPGYELFTPEGTRVGQVTSGGISPLTGQGIGLAYVDVPHHKAGTPLRLQVRNKNLAVEVSRPPFVEL